MAALLSPICQQNFDNDGNPAASGRLYTTLTGTTTHRVAYTDQAGVTSQTYVSDGAGGLYIALDTAGRIQPSLWLAPGVEYRLRLTNSAGTLIDEWDDIAGIPANLYYTVAGDAVGDGTTNDYTAISAAITAAPTGGVLLLEPGKNYRINTGLTIAKALTVWGYGAKINTGTSQIAAITITASNVSILGLEIEGGGNGSFNTNGKLIVATGTDNGAAVAPTYITGITIRDCELYEAGRCAIRLDYVRKATIENNDIHDIGYSGGEIQSSLDVDWSGGFIKDVTPGTSSNMYGIYVSRINDADLVRYPICERITISRVHLEDIEWEGIDCHGGNDISFLYNTLNNCGNTNAAIAFIHADNNASVPIAGVSNGVAIGNVVRGAQRYGIATSTMGGTSIRHTGIVISGNSLHNIGLSSTSDNIGGIRIGSVVGGTVSGNTLSYCAPYGVIVNHLYATGISITGNSFYRIVSNTETTPAAILIDRGASASGTTVLIGGNTLTLAAAGETYEAVNGVRVESTDVGTVSITENSFHLASTPYFITVAQADGMSAPISNFGEDSIAVTTAVASANKVITLPNVHSGGTIFTPSAVIWRATSNETTLIQCSRTSTSSITVTVRTASGANFAANGNIDFYWSTKGY